MRRQRMRSPRAKAPKTDPRMMAKLLWCGLWLFEDEAADVVDAAPASEAELIVVEEGVTFIEVMDDDEVVVEVVEGVVDALEFGVEVAVVCASEARIEVTSV